MAFNTAHILEWVRTAFGIALVVAALGGAPAAARTGVVTLMGQVNIPNAIFTSDVWGYVDPDDGKEYAVVGDVSNWRLWMVDVSDPTNPVVVSELAGVPTFDVKVYGNYAYGCDGDKFGFDSKVVDISDPANPFVVGNGFPTAHNIAISDAGIMYLEWPGLRAYDLKQTPTYPTYIWQDGSGDAHDSTPVGNRLYDFRGPFGTYIWDISNPLAPVKLGTIRDDRINYHHSGSGTGDGNYVFICNELAKHPTADITVWDISNPALPVYVTDITDETATVHNLLIRGDHAFISHYTSGFKVYDISDPTNPALADEYDTSVFSGEGWTNGAFGVYPFAPSGYVYVTDQQNGLFVFRFDTNATPTFIRSFTATVTPAGVRLDWNVFSDEGISGYRVYRRFGEGDFVSVTPQLLTTRSYLDREVEAGQRYDYILGVRRLDLPELRSTPAAVNIPAGRIALHQNSPNPFSPSTSIPFELERSADVSLRIFDAGGRFVRDLINGPRAGGRNEAAWDGRDDEGRHVASGVYFYKLRTGKTTLTRRMVLLR